MWTLGFTKYPELFGVSRAVKGIWVEGANMKYIGDEKKWEECHNGLRKKVLVNYKYFEYIIDWQMSFGKKFNNWSEKNIYLADVQKMSADRIMSLYKEFIDRQSTLYALGVAIPILDFQNFSFVEGNLEKFLKSKLSGEEYNEVFRIFTEPAFNSFAQEQEIALLKLMSKFYSDGKMREDAKFNKLLQKHAEKYGWIYYVYAGPAYTAKDFLGFIKDYLHKNANPKEKLKEINNHQKQIKKLKKIWLKKLQPDKFNKLILNLAGKVVWAKPRRKDLQSYSYYHLEKLQREIGRRLHLSLAQVRSTPIEMLEIALPGGELDINKINQIQKSHICLPNDDLSISILFGGEADDFKNKYLKIEKEEIINVAELKGACAYPGKVQGVVRRIDLPEQMFKMQYGDILLSTGTTPSIVPAMKKAGAIITDEGGLTCHASIVSRELQIPCVIGTKNATRVLKDGDKVEVDATNGIIKKI